MDLVVVKKPIKKYKKPIKKNTNINKCGVAIFLPNDFDDMKDSKLNKQPIIVDLGDNMCKIALDHCTERFSKEGYYFAGYLQDPK